jgi:hypothetical protein
VASGVEKLKTASVADVQRAGEASRYVSRTGGGGGSGGGGGMSLVTVIEYVAVCKPSCARELTTIVVSACSFRGSAEDICPVFTSTPATEMCVSSASCLSGSARAVTYNRLCSTGTCTWYVNVSGSKTGESTPPPEMASSASLASPMGANFLALREYVRLAAPLSAVTVSSSVCGPAMRKYTYCRSFVHTPP